MSLHELDPSALSEPQRTVLRAIGWWYNGVQVSWNNTAYRLGETIPLDIENLVRIRLGNVEGLELDAWEDTYRPAYEWLYTDGWLQPVMLFRKRINWAPSRAARQFLDDDLSVDDPWAKYVPDAYDYSGGLVGDLNEGMKHRCGVELVRSAFPAKRFSGFEMYPGDGSEPQLDIHAVRQGTAWGIEILCDHNNRDAYRRKYQQAAQTNRCIYYVFQNRRLANECLNLWTEADDVQCDIVNYPLNPEQRSMQDAYEYVRRSVESADRPTPGIHQINTILRLYDQLLDDGE
ncbi:hypothetical protein [Halobellus marinus]|uniref:hypothetical protein n=1 Tax=Halobellus TaxID=1073986 RepID=UPI0028AAC2AB|nr:hypothetical protein [Halobellus sp. DFY28]